MLQAGGLQKLLVEDYPGPKAVGFSLRVGDTLSLQLKKKKISL